MVPLRSNHITLIIVTLTFVLLLICNPSREYLYDQGNFDSILINLKGRHIVLAIPSYSHIIVSLPTDLSYAQKFILSNRQTITSAAQRYDIASKLLASIFYCECFFNPRCFQKTEIAYIKIVKLFHHYPDISFGPAQIRPSTAFYYLHLTQSSMRNLSNDALIRNNWQQEQATIKSHLFEKLLDNKTYIYTAAEIVSKIKMLSELWFDNNKIHYSDQQLIETIGNCYNGGIKNISVSTGSRSYGRIIFQLYKNEPIINAYFEH